MENVPSSARGSTQPFWERHGPSANCAIPSVNQAGRCAATATSRDAVNQAMIAGLRRELTDTGYQKLDAEWHKFIKSLPPAIDTEVFPLPDRVGKRGADDFSPASPSILWLDKTSKSKFVVTARPMLAQVGQADFAFERSRGRWIRVTLLGGPCDGETRLQPVLPSWTSLELQIRFDVALIMSLRDLYN